MRPIATVLALLMAAPAFAAPTTYLCAFDSARSGGWVAPAIQIAHDRATGRVEVLDPIILGHLGGPVDGDATARGDSVTYSWFLRNFRSPAGQLTARMAYRVKIRLADGTATGRMQPAGYVGVYSAPGRCQQQR